VCVGVHVDTVQRLSDKANELMAEKVGRKGRIYCTTCVHKHIYIYNSTKLIIYIFIYACL